MAVVDKIIVCLVTRVCLTSAILVGKASLDPNIPRPWHSYLPTTSAPFPKHPNHQYDNHATDSELEKLAFSRDLQAKRPMGLQSASTLNNHKQKLQTSPQRFPVEIHQNDVWLSATVPRTSSSPPPPTTTTTTTTMLSGPRGVRGYQNIEVLDEYLTEELDDSKLPYREKAESTAYYYHRRPQDLTAAIKALDRFLSRTLNDDSYNSKLHPPPNPILALILSRYGRYVPGTRNPRVYAYMAVNNIHNHQPFGKYKYEHDEEPIYVVR
nr:PREDICTED: uncharacterized protein LOC105671579 [Linepithema humile]